MNIKFVFALLIVMLSFNAGKSHAKVVLPRLISNGMVLQRDKPIRIWGWGNPDECITISFNGKKYKAIATTEKKWQLNMPAMKAGGPYTIVIKGENEIILRDVLIGDVWLCSGQSNMEFNMDRVKDKYPAEIKASANPMIRQFKVGASWGFSPKDDVVSSGWKAADPNTLLQFTAVGYFFARSIFENNKVPIGLINTSYGGSKAEAWLSDEAIRAFPEYVEEANKFKDPANVNVVIQKDNALIEDWIKNVEKNDKGSNSQSSWTTPDADTSTWKEITVPGYWESSKAVGKIDGVVWFRKQIYIPAVDADKDAILSLGFIDDRNSAYFNGKLVGSATNKYLASKYKIPAALIKPGMNVITVRVIDTDGTGGFIPGKEYGFAAGASKITLAGTWKVRIGAVSDPLPTAKLTKWYFKPTSLYNNMIYPIINYTIKGFLWYQGESNTDFPKDYQTVFSALIKDFRREWGQSDLPFIYVQLPNYNKPVQQPTDAQHWAELREVQTNTLKLPNTGMAITHDLGETYEIHPANKKEVGDRLALVAEHVAYGAAVNPYSGPLFQSMRVEGNKLIITFDQIGSGLIAKDGKELHYFAIAGADKKYVWARAKIEGNGVVVWSDAVPIPVSVRYAWADNPEGANLYNKDGLPASSFRAGE